MFSVTYDNQLSESDIELIKVKIILKLFFSRNDDGFVCLCIVWVCLFCVNEKLSE